MSIIQLKKQLDIAITKGNFERYRQLVNKINRAEYDLNIFNPLHAAINSNQFDIFEDLMLTPNIDINRRINDGHTPLEEIVSVYHIDQDEKIKYIKLLLNDGAIFGNALHIAIVNRLFDVAIYLINHGANPSAINDKGQDAYQLAEIYGSPSFNDWLNGLIDIKEPDIE